MRKAVIVGTLAAGLVFPSFVAAQVVRDMTSNDIKQAIALGAKAKDIELHEIKSQSGFSWDSDKVRWGYFSTPFLRVAMAANSAKKQYKSFTERDVTPELVAPELHVYASAASLGGMRVANVEAVVITKVGQEDRSSAVHPAKITELPEEYLNLFGARVSGRSVFAVFPLEVLSGQNEIHIVFDTRVKSGATGCEDCKMRFNLKGVR